MPMPAEVKAGYRWRWRQELNGRDRYCKLAKRLWPGRSKEHPEHSLPKAALQRQPPQPPYRCWVHWLIWPKPHSDEASGIRIFARSARARWTIRGGRRLRSGASTRTAIGYGVGSCWGTSSIWGPFQTMSLVGSRVRSRGRLLSRLLD